MTTEPTVIIGLHNPKSPTNVGAVMRAAGCYNATQVRYNGTRYSRAARFQTDTQNCRVGGRCHCATAFRPSWKSHLSVWPRRWFTAARDGRQGTMWWCTIA